MSTIEAVVEKSFISPGRVNEDISANPEIQTIIHDLSFAWKAKGLQSLTELMNASLILESTQAYTSAQDLIRASNQNYWAAVAYMELSHPSSIEFTVQLQRIAGILYGYNIKTPYVQKGHEMMLKSLEFGDAAVNVGVSSR